MGPPLRAGCTEGALSYTLKPPDLGLGHLVWFQATGLRGIDGQYIYHIHNYSGAEPYGHAYHYLPPYYYCLLPKGEEDYMH